MQFVTADTLTLFFFIQDAFIGNSCTMTNAVTRCKGRGLVSSVIQNEEANTKNVEKIYRNKTGSCAWKGSTLPACKWHSLLRILRWVEKEQKIHEAAGGHCIMIKFLCSDIIYQCNMNMNGASIADQVCSHYHIDHWLHKQKLWWVIQVNTYILYKTAHIHV